MQQPFKLPALPKKVKDNEPVMGKEFNALVDLVEGIVKGLNTLPTLTLTQYPDKPDTIILDKSEYIIGDPIDGKPIVDSPVEEPVVTQPAPEAPVVKYRVPEIEVTDNITANNKVLFNVPLAVGCQGIVVTKFDNGTSTKLAITANLSKAPKDLWIKDDEIYKDNKGQVYVTNMKTSARVEGEGFLRYVFLGSSIRIEVRSVNTQDWTLVKEIPQKQVPMLLKAYKGDSPINIEVGEGL